jgi:hypothetical protein
MLYFVLAIAALVGILTVIGVVLIVPVVDGARERARIEVEAAEASWKIHQQATEAFGQMLDMGRDHQHRETDR